MNQVIKIVTISILLGLFQTSCGGGSGSENSTETITPSNPIAQSIQLFGQGGNIWKPEADAISSGAGNLVVLFDQQFSTRFDTCEVTLADGSIAPLICIDFEPWTQIPFSCFSNNNRQTWRAGFKCDAVTKVEVVCRDINQEVTFTVPDELKSFVCNRFG